MLSRVPVTTWELIHVRAHAIRVHVHGYDIWPSVCDIAQFCEVSIETAADRLHTQIEHIKMTRKTLLSEGIQAE